MQIPAELPSAQAHRETEFSFPPVDSASAMTDVRQTGSNGGMESASDYNEGAVASTSGKPLGPERLLDVTEQVYRAYNPAKVTLDTHADEQLSSMQLASQFDETFIRQVLYGVVRYRQFLGSLMDSFYYYSRCANGRNAGQATELHACMQHGLMQTMRRMAPLDSNFTVGELKHSGCS